MILPGNRFETLNRFERYKSCFIWLILSFQASNPRWFGFVSHDLFIEGDEQYIAGLPTHLFALGVGFPDTGSSTATATYMVNIVEMRGWLDFDEDDD